MNSRNDNSLNTTPSVEGFPDEDIKIVSSFDDMYLDMLLLQGIYGYGWENPTSIQERVIVPMKEGLVLRFRLPILLKEWHKS